MTDPFDFEPRLEARLIAHAARATRPFDAATIAVSAAAVAPRRTLALPLHRPASRRAFTPMAATFALVALLVALIGAMLLAGSRPPFPAILLPAPTASREPSARPEASEGMPSPTPAATPGVLLPAGPSELLVKTGNLMGQTWEMPCDNVDRIDPVTGAAQRLITCADRVSISPDGSRASVGGPLGVAIIELRDGRQVGTIDTGKPTYPIGWSPTGRWLQMNVCRYRDSTPDYGPCHVTIVSTIDGSQVVLPGGGGSGYSPGDWMPDESHLLVPGPGPTEMRIGDPDGTDLKPLADESAQAIWWWRSYGRAAAMSPDGARVAYAWGPYENGGDMPTTNLWVMSIGGTDRHALTSFEPGARLRGVEWSPDGTRMAFVKSLPSTSGVESAELWLIESDGSQRRVAVPGELHSILNWSPDGFRLALQVSTGSGKGSSVDTLILPLDGSAPVVLKDARGAAWSPDGRSLAITHTTDSVDRREGDPIPPATIEVVGFDGSDRHKVATPTSDLDGFWFIWAAP